MRGPSPRGYRCRHIDPTTEDGILATGHPVHKRCAGEPLDYGAIERDWDGHIVERTWLGEKPETIAEKVGCREETARLVGSWFLREQREYEHHAKLRAQAAAAERYRQRNLYAKARAKISDALKRRRAENAGKPFHSAY